MSVEQEAYTVREAVGVFNHPEDLQGAIDELLSSGFDRAELSLLASEHVVEQKLGHRYEKVSSLADDPTIPRAAYVSTEAIGGAEGGLIGGLMYVGAAATAGAIVASGGTLATAIAATALAGGAGGLIGSILAKWVGDRRAHVQQAPCRAAWPPKPNIWQTSLPRGWRRASRRRDRQTYSRTSGPSDMPARHRDVIAVYAPAHTHDLLRLSHVGLHLFVSPNALQRPLCAS